jgi:SdrD B-like domain
MRKSFIYQFFIQSIGIAIFFIGFCTTINAQVSGKVFRDFNANGIQTTAAPDPVEPGLKDVTVNAYDAGGSYTATTDATGAYSITGGTGPYRVEFILPAFYYASKGSVSNTTVQFVAANGVANLGANYPSDYCHTLNPKVIIPLYTNGSATDNGVITENALVKFDFNTNSSTVGSASDYPAKVGDLGAVYGVAYNRVSNNIYTSAILKRHVGLKNGLGAIYVTNAATNVTTLFTTVANVGTIDEAARGLSSTSSPSRDAEAFAKVGKVGLGDMDISEDGNFLYVVNLFEKKLVKIEIASPTNQVTYDIPSSGCTGGERRPFGLGIRRGKVYVGTVCTAEAGGSLSNMNATVYAFDGATFTSVLDFALDYERGEANKDIPLPPTGSTSQWLPWTDDEYTFFNQYRWFDLSDAAFEYPQPILSDIEFDQNDGMILGFMDRAGHQAGHFNYPPSTGTSYENALYYVNTAGDLRYAYRSGSNVWTAEMGGDKDGAGAFVPNASQSGTGGEFYYQDNYLDNHMETAQGGLGT